MEGQKLLNMIDVISVEKKISKDIIIDSIKDGFIKSYEKHHPNSIVDVAIDDKTGELKIRIGYTVIEDPELKEENNILLKDALLMKKDAKIDDILYEELDYDTFTRSSAIQVAQILRQQIREAEKKSIYEEYKDKINEVITGKVVINKEPYCLLEVGRTFAFLPRKNMLVNDNFDVDDRIKFYVEDISQTSKNSGQILGTRVNNEFLNKILENEIPEIFEGIVQIKDIAREPGVRSKISVYTENENIDPVGTCVGINGSRIKKIINELNGENIDVCKWSPDKKEYIKNVFSIVNITHIEMLSDNEINLVIPKEQLSLAIGKKGMTIKLCANLLSLKINVLSSLEYSGGGVIEEETLIENSTETLSESVEMKKIIELTKPIEKIDNSIESPKIEEVKPLIKEIIDIKNETISEPKITEIVTDETKNSYQKLKIQFELLSEKIGILNNKKYDNSTLAKEIRIKFIDLFSYFNDYDQKNITNSAFNYIKANINIKTLKNYCEFVNDSTINEIIENPIETIDKKNDSIPEEKLITENPEKIEKINEELNFYSKIENKEQKLDDEYYDNINYDEFDEYYD